ncbi:MAG: ABC transporter ATP-binding protein, partial [Clostridia bacterium]|nr:ABC transporter ATP-binding protein [Clostridia bacterium]
MVFGKNVNRYYLKYAPMLLLGIAALFLVDFMQLKSPEIYSSVINALNGEIPGFDMDYLLMEVCLPLLVIVLTLVFGRFLWRICFFGTAIRIESDIRSRMFDHCKDLSLQYYQVNKVGNLMSLFTNDLETIQDCFGGGILQFFDALLLGCMALFKMFRMNWLLSLFSLAPMVVLFLCGKIIMKYMMTKWDERQAAFSRLSDFSQESFTGIAVIKAFVKEGRELLAFRKLNRENESANVTFVRYSSLLNVGVTFFVGLVIAIILGYGGYLVYDGVFNAGELLEFVSYFTAIVWPVMAVTELLEMTSRGRASVKRIDELLDAEIDVKDREGVTEGDPLIGGIEFRNLTFRYPGASYDALEDVSFRIEAGENIGVIGKTGAGKTTLVDLILRMYNVPDGTIFLDGRDINSIPIKSVRSYASYVPQDNFLFSDTITSNIGFASDGYTEEDVARVAALADLDENVHELPDGYGTLLGERGVTVSGGQKQRISIARAL